MNDDRTDLDQADEVLIAEVSDDALEAAAGTDTGARTGWTCNTGCNC